MLRQISVYAVLAVAIVLASGGPHAMASVNLAVSGFVSGDTVTATLTAGQSLMGDTSTTLSLTTPGYSTETWNSSQGGLLGWTQVSVNGFGPVQDPSFAPNTGHYLAFNTACVEVVQNVYWDSKATWTIQSLASAPEPNNINGLSGGMGSTAADLIQQLYNNYASNFATASPGGASLFAGAFQMAIWKIEYDSTKVDTGGNVVPNQSPGSFDFNTGRLTATAGTDETKLATAMLNGGTFGSMPYSRLTGATGDQSANPTVYALVSTTGGDGNNGFQDQAIAFVTLGNTAVSASVVPEPASLVIWSLLAGGSASLAVARKRRQGSGPRWSRENREAILAAVIGKDVTNS